MVIKEEGSWSSTVILSGYVSDGKDRVASLVAEK